MTTAGITPARVDALAEALSPPMLRAFLLLGCALAAAIALGYGFPQAAIRVDRDLAFLLRGMALIKASLVLAAVGVLWWRLGHAIDRGAAAGYLAGAFLMSAASGLIWQLTLIGLAALAFHVGVFMVLLIAYFDRDAMRLTNRDSRLSLERAARLRRDPAAIEIARPRPDRRHVVSVQDTLFE